MITDNLKNHEQYISVQKDFAKVFDFFKTLNENSQQCKHIIEEDNVWINVFELVPDTSAEKNYEAHRDFIDIHYIVSGSEKFGYANIDKLTVCKEYNEDEDYLLLNGEVNSLTLNKGDFIVTFPEDAHIPDMEKVGNEKLIRAVAKIRI